MKNKKKLTKKAKLGIAIAAQVAAFFGTIFGLLRFSDSFAILGIYFLVGAMATVTVLIDVAQNKTPNLVVPGAFMCFFGTILGLISLDNDGRWITIPPSVIVVLLGIALIVQGIIGLSRLRKTTGSVNKSRTNGGKKPTDVKVVIGILMIVFGFFVVPAISRLTHSSVAILGVIILVAGIVMVVLGKRSQRAKKPASKSPGYNGDTIEILVPGIGACARCQKKISDLPESQVCVIEGFKYCMDCKEAVEREIEVNHMVCAVCGIDLPMENIHIIDGVQMCHQCFLDKYGKIEY